MSEIEEEEERKTVTYRMGKVTLQYSKPVCPHTLTYLPPHSSTHSYQLSVLLLQLAVLLLQSGDPEAQLSVFQHHISLLGGVHSWLWAGIGVTSAFSNTHTHTHTHTHTPHTHTHHTHTHTRISLSLGMYTHGCGQE